MKKNLKVCVGITTYNRASVLRKAIESALGQDYPCKEVRVVDDASTDSTHEIRHEYPEVIWHQNHQQQGLRDARNFMMSETDADLFCSLDDDSWFLTRNGLSKGVEIFDSYPTLAGLGFEILDESNPNGSQVCRIQKSHMFIGCGHLVRLCAARQVGLYHDMPNAYGGEEKDLCIRLLDNGFDIVRYDGVHVWHDKSFNARNVPNQHLSGVGNDLWLMLTRAPLKSLPITLPVQMASHLRFAIQFAYRDISSMSEFDRRIRKENGRFVFLLPCVRAICRLIVNSRNLWSERDAVEPSTFQEYRRRSRGLR